MHVDVAVNTPVQPGSSKRACLVKGSRFPNTTFPIVSQSLPSHGEKKGLAVVTPRQLSSATLSFSLTFHIEASLSPSSAPPPPLSSPSPYCLFSALLLPYYGGKTGS